MHRTRARLECKAIDYDAQVVELHGTEEISQLFDFEVLVTIPQAPVARAKDLVGERLSLIVEVAHGDGDFQEVRRINGLIAECYETASLADNAHYVIRLVPALWMATLVETLDIFMDMSVIDILRAKLKLFDLEEGIDYELRLDPVNHYPVREFVVQYKETDLDFLRRLLEHEGIFFFFEHREERDVPVFSDFNGGFHELGDEPLTFGPRDEALGVQELRARTRLIPRMFVQRDYNYRNPGTDLTAQTELASGFGGGVVEYGAHFKTQEEADRIVRVRSEERQRQHRGIVGRADVPRCRAGGRFNLSGHPHGALDLILTKTTHRLRQPAFAGGGDDLEIGYRCDFEALESSIPYRPARTVHKPRIHGVVTGIIDGATVGQYAELDEQGRYKVRFMFDTSGRGEGKASRSVRMMQPHAGAGYGMHFPLRVGTEVLIVFMDGDPDRPIIAGTIPNPQTPSPVVADNAHKNVIRTGGGNEIDIDDTEDSQRIKLSSPYGGSLVQIGSPNAAESGVVLGTSNNVTTTAGGTANTMTAFQSNWATFNDTWSAHITGFAGPTTPLAALQFGLDTFTGLASTISGINSSITAVQDGIINQKKVALEKAKKDQKEANGELDAAQQAHAAKVAAVKACLDNAPSNLDTDSQARLQALRDAMDGYDDAVAKLAADIAARDEKITEKAEFTEAGKDTSAAALQPDIDGYEAAISADRKAIDSAQSGIDGAIGSIEGDPDLAYLHAEGGTCTATLKAYDSSQTELAAKQKAADDARQNVESIQGEIATTEANQKDTRDDVAAVSGYTDAITSGASTFTQPLFSLVTTIWGTGMQGFARNTADFLLTDAAGAAMAYTNRVKPTGFAWTPMPPFMVTKPPDMTTPYSNPEKGRISRLLWFTDLLAKTKMLPGGGAGLKGLGMGKAAALALIPILGPILAYKFNKGAFAEARNIQGSDDHSVLFGLKSVFVSGQEHAALHSGEKLVVTADQRVEVHSRDETEVSGNEVMLTAADKVDVLSRGQVSLIATGPPDVVTPNSAPSRFGAPVNLDKNRSKLTLERGEATMAARDGGDTKDLASIALSGDDVTSQGKVAIQTDGGHKLTIDQTSQSIAVDTPGDVKVSGDQSIVLQSGASKIEVKPDGITLEVGPAKIQLKNDQAVMKLGNSVACLLKNEQASLSWGLTKVVLKAGILELKGAVQKQQ